MKPTSIDGYDPKLTQDCERLLVTLLRGLGPWKESIYLVGGLTPRYLVKDQPPKVPPHAGTQDIDLVVHLAMLTDTKAYQTLEANLKRLGFERGENDNMQKVSWRWKVKTEHGATLLLEFLADDPNLGGGKVQELPTSGAVSALNVPHASMVFDMHETTELTVELLGEGGVSTEQVRYADLVSFTCLKTLAFDDRNEPKDAHDLVYCLEHAVESVEAAGAQFRRRMAEGKHAEVINHCLERLAARFVTDAKAEGYRKDGPVAAARFEDRDRDRDRRVLRQREVSELIERFLKAVRAG